MSATDGADGIRRDFEHAVDQVFRDHGDFGKHSDACVYVKGKYDRTEWCCAEDCEIAKRERSRRPRG